MSSDLHVMVIKIPSLVTIEYIGELKEKALTVSMEVVMLLNEFISYDLEDLDVSDDIEESDLFNLTSDDLKLKKASREHLVLSIDRILTHRVGLDSRMGIPIYSEGVKYVEIEGGVYAVSAYRPSYLSKKVTSSYSHLIALNMSGIMNT
jgi:hypothetical protein